MAASQGQKTPGDKILMSTETSCYIGHLLQVKKKSLLSLILSHPPPLFFVILYMYVALGHGLTVPLGRNFDANRNILSLRSFITSFKKISLKSDFIHVFMILYMYIAPGQGQTAPRGQSFDVNRHDMSCQFTHLL